MTDDFPGRIDPLAPDAGAYDAVMSTVRHRRRRKAGVLSGSAVVLALALGVGAAAVGSGGTGASDSLDIAVPTPTPAVSTTPSAEVTPSMTTTPSTSPSASTSPSVVPTSPASSPAVTTTPTPTPTAPPLEPAPPCLPFLGRAVSPEGTPVSGMVVNADVGPSSVAGVTDSRGWFSAPVGASSITLRPDQDRLGTSFVPRLLGTGLSPTGDDLCGRAGPDGTPVRTDVALRRGNVLEGTVRVEDCLELAPTGGDISYTVYQEADAGVTETIFLVPIRFTRTSATTVAFRVVGVPASDPTDFVDVLLPLSTPQLEVYAGVFDLPTPVGGKAQLDIELTRKDVRSRTSGPVVLPSACTAPPSVTPSP